MKYDLLEATCVDDEETSALGLGDDKRLTDGAQRSVLRTR
jgi:hypothetical protein